MPQLIHQTTLQGVSRVPVFSKVYIGDMIFARGIRQCKVSMYCQDGATKPALTLYCCYEKAVLSHESLQHTGLKIAPDLPARNH